MPRADGPSAHPLPRRTPTMADVARHVGVSRQLVGLAFRHEAGVGADTKERIFAAARELGYSPNVAAQSLRRPTTRYIGVLFDLGHSAPPEIIDALYQVAAMHGYRLVLSASFPDRREQDAIDELIGHLCEALVLIAPRLDATTLRSIAERVPTVTVGHASPDSGCDSVRSRGDDGIARIVDHLADLGHSRIAYVHARSMLDAELRFSGYSRRMRDRGFEARALSIDGPYTEEAGALAAEQFLSAGELPTAIMCSNDQAALGLIVRLMKAGVQVPADVSVTGYDDSNIARLSFLDLTTVRQDPAEVAATTMAAALNRISDRDRPTTDTFTSSALVVRSTTTAPRT